MPNKKGKKKRAAKQKYGDPVSKRGHNQSDLSDSDSEAPTSMSVNALHSIDSQLPASKPKTSLLSEKAKILNNPQTIINESTLKEPLLEGKATVKLEQKLSQSIGKSSSLLSRSVQSTSLSRSIPKSIPRRSSQNKIATPTSIFQSINRKSLAESDSEREDQMRQEVTEIIAEHLVRPKEIPNDKTSGISFGSMSHSLVGGAITSDIYKWQESRQKEGLRLRSNSEPDIVSIISPDSVPTASDIREPGGFRRHFIVNKARNEGKKPPNFLTSNFIDFLVLYGFYGGDVYPSDDEDEEQDDLPSQRPPNDIEANNETAPLLQRQASTTITPVKGTSEAKAFFMLLKAFVGTGVLFLPKAFVNGGIIFSIVLMVIFGFLTMHCMILLVETSRSFGGKSFGDLGQIIYGEKCKFLVLGSIAISQMGFCCAYYIFVGQNLRDLLMITSDCKLILPDWFFICIQLLFYIPLAWVRRIKNFGITSLIADVFILGGLGYIFTYDLVLIGQDGIKDVAWINLQSFPLFIGTAMFAFEGICLMLPIAESMKYPERFNRVVIIGMLAIAILFISIGALGYLALGDKVETIVFLNLPKTPMVTGLQFLYAIAIMLSFPLCIYPAIRITEQGIFGLSTGKSSPLVKWQKNLYRAALASALGVVAWAGSANLDKVVSLVGCFACIPLSFIYPALFHTHITQSKWVKLKDWCIVIFGTLATVYTTYITLQQWVVGSPDIPLDRCHDNSGNLLKFPRV